MESNDKTGARDVIAAIALLNVVLDHVSVYKACSQVAQAPLNLCHRLILHA